MAREVAAARIEAARATNGGHHIVIEFATEREGAAQLRIPASEAIKLMMLVSEATSQAQQDTATNRRIKHVWPLQSWQIQVLENQEGGEILGLSLQIPGGALLTFGLPEGEVLRLADELRASTKSVTKGRPTS